MIRVLDKTTIDKIAAGEVIERPYSVVKELLENSIDAGSTMITVEIKEGGMSLIRVTDNGCGIPDDQVRTAYMRHATSKITTADDLDSIISLGFRGEALSTIAAVSQTEMITKQSDALTGVKYVIHGGEEIEFGQVGVPNGTTVVVRNLFFNTPARKKFLKSPMTEASYINDLVLKIALSHPEISFKLIVNNQTKIDTSGNGKVKDAIYQLFGRDITNNLIEVNHEENGVKITGYIGKPYVSRGNRGLENYFINNRYIKSNIVNRAIEEGYKTFVMQHKFPFTVLYIGLSADKCDVNVHPTKMEFKYDNERELFEIVTRCVRNALLDRELIPKPGISNEADIKKERQEQLQTKANEAKVKPPEPFEMKRSSNTSSTISKNISQYSALSKLTKEDEKNSSSILESLLKDEGAVYTPSNKAQANNIQTNNVDNIKPTTEEVVNKQTASKSINNSSKENINKYNTTENTFLKDKVETNNAALDILNKSIETEASTENINKDTMASNNSIDVNNKDNQNTSEISQNKTLGNNNVETSITYDKNANKQVNTYNTQTSLFDNEFLTSTARPKHRLIGQLFETYWLIQYEDNLYIMDQHAAHEKVKYEELIDNLNNKEVYSQQIMPPIVITVSYAERQAILDHYDLFMKIGYDITEFGGNEFKVNAVPANLYGIDVKELLLNFVSDLIDNSGYVSNDVFIKKLSTMACKSAIKGNTKISYAEADRLIDQLLKLENPYTCPHGRPTIISISENEIEKKFKRIV